VYGRGEPPAHTHDDRIAFAKAHSGEVQLIERFNVPAEMRLSPQKLLNLLNNAAAHLRKGQERSRLHPKVTVWLHVEDFCNFQILLDETDYFQISAAAPATPYLKVLISYDILIALLTTHVSWNNLEIGCHVRFFREPDVYDPDVHTLLSFLHL
jgi:hypothetical protein